MTFTWTSQTILDDDDGAHNTRQAELVTILSGQSVEMWQPRSVLHLIGSELGGGADRADPPAR